MDTSLPRVVRLREGLSSEAITEAMARLLWGGYRVEPIFDGLTGLLDGWTREEIAGLNQEQYVVLLGLVMVRLQRWVAAGGRPA